MEKVIREIKDNSYRKILSEPELFCQFIRNFIPVELLKDIQPDDIQDHTERYLPLISGNRDTDVVKLINIPKREIFVIALVEAQTKVKFLMSLRILEYCVCIWKEWCKDCEKEKKGSTAAKGFLLPPVLPIVYYSGTGKWTAPVNFIDKIAYKDVFGKYIPNFCYEVVSLSGITIKELMELEDALSFILLMDKIKNPGKIKYILKQVDKAYIEKIKGKIPENLWELIYTVVTLFLMKLNVPKDEIETVTKHLTERKITEMFSLMETYDVQETRRIARQEGLQKGLQKGRQEGRQKGRQEGRQEGQMEGRKEECIQLVIKLIQKKIKKIPKSYEKKIKALSLDKLEQIVDSIFEIEQLSDLEPFL